VAPGPKTAICTACYDKNATMELRIDRAVVDRSRERARAIVAPVSEFIDAHSTLAVERTVLRLLGVDGVGPDEVPLPNLLVDALSPDECARGAARIFGKALAETGLEPAALGEAVGAGRYALSDFANVPEEAARGALQPFVEASLARIRAQRLEREERLSRLPQLAPPLLYVIVASGNIYEDRTAAVAAAEAGAQVIAVIRSTGQSLLDFVPYGPTTEGFGGTYATQANFRIMREALDEVSERLGRYVMLTNYASGLCMPEIAAMAALERLDMLLNDSMYGILFRDINMKRTFVDQHFSRMLNAYSGITINTGEDNYLTTADAVEQAPAVLASQLINEAFAHRAAMPDRQIGLGDAYEIDPDLQDGFLYELAQAQLERQIFPDAPLKYMPPTKHMTGNIFKGHLIDAMFNLTSVMTKQTIHLCGMLTEAIHTPFLGDRALSLENARYIMNTARHFGDEITVKPGGIIERRAQSVLSDCEALLHRVADMGLMDAIEAAVFADVSRAPDGGRGFDGVFERGADYWNPYEDALEAALRQAQGDTEDGEGGNRVMLTLSKRGQPS
jgi:beta-lysine 5,6-aminomutase alpha subunit